MPHHSSWTLRRGLFLAAPRPHIPAMPFPTIPDPAANREHEHARRHPDRETLELATAGPASSCEHSQTETSGVLGWWGE